MTLAYVVGKNTGPDALANAAAYAPHFAAATYLDAYAHYAGQFTTWSDTAIRPAIAWVLAGCILAAVALRNRVLQWAALFNVVAIAPIAFISPRNGFAFYVPLVGWAVFVAALLRQAREFAVRRRPALRVWSQAALAAALAFSVPYREIRPMNRVRLPAVRADQNEARRLYGEIRGLLPEALEHKRVLALNEPYKFEYAFVLIVQFAWNEPDLTVFTAKLLRERGIQPSPQDYDVVLDYVDGHFVRVDASRRDQGRGEP
jgi:hypothetical protein